MDGIAMFDTHTIYEDRINSLPIEKKSGKSVVNINVLAVGSVKEKEGIRVAIQNIKLLISNKQKGEKELCHNDIARRNCIEKIIYRAKLKLII